MELWVSAAGGRGPGIYQVIVRLGESQVRHAKDKARWQSAGNGENVRNKRQNRSSEIQRLSARKGFFKKQV